MSNYERFSVSFDKLHASEKRDELIQRAARVICCVNGQCYRPEKCASWSFTGEATAAIAVALEEAAAMIEARYGYGVSRQIAADVRAMIPPDR